MNKNTNLPYKIKKMEEEPVITTNGNNEYSIDEAIPLNYIYEYLYHGIRFQNHLEKLENIFIEKRLLAGKYIKNYHTYSDNCNKGEYISLLKPSYDNKIYYESFIIPNISLLITPLCNAIETKYVDYYTWEKIKKYELKQIYSYMPNEYMCKDYIDINMVCAIGVPYHNLINEKGKHYTNYLIEEIIILMKKYNIYLPIVDTSRYNYIIRKFEKNNIKKKTK